MTQENSIDKRGLDSGGIAVSGLLAAVAVWVLWQSGGFSPFAAIFPRAVGAALLLCSLAVLWRLLRQPAEAKGEMDSQGLVRSALLVLTMIAWVALLESAGFALSSMLSFFLLAVLAHRDEWSAKRVLLFAAAAVIMVLLLQLLFQRGLDVRLPAGTWLPGLFG